MAKARGPGESDSFVRFVQSLRENGEVAELLRKAAKIPREIRYILFEQMAAKMRASGEPDRIVEVVDFLRDDRIFKKVIEMLDAPGP